MNKRNLIIGGAVVLIAVLAIGILFLHRSSDEDLLRRTIINNEDRASETAAELQHTDRITTVLVGTGSAIDQLGPQTCTTVFVNGQFLLFDTGNNSWSAMNGLDFPMEELDAVFITHYHNDHYADLGEVMEMS
jgi:ribonuclease Z